MELWLVVFLRRGKEHGLPSGLPDYERDLPSQDPPALVGWLVTWGQVTEASLVATVMDLARRVKLGLRREIRPVVFSNGAYATQEVTVLAYRAPADTDWEADVMGLLARAAQGRAEVTDAELRGWVEANRAEAHNWWVSWSRKVDALARSRAWIEPSGGGTRSLLLGLGLCSAGIVGLGLGASGLLSLLTVLAGAALAAVGGFVMRRRSPIGNVLAHRWRRFAAFLAEYSLLPERTPDALALWGRYLVYAVPLGVAGTVVRNLDANLSAPELYSATGGWYLLGQGGLSASRGLSASLWSLLPAVPVSRPPAPQSSGSSSSPSFGGGGGFSRGGGGRGGGGGGSGGGAF